MGIYLNPGNEMFQESLNSLFYVDKTRLAALVTSTFNTSMKYTCVSRPRRFGKSVDADMLVAYYSKGAESRALFEHLDIADTPAFEAHLNAHDVIRLDVQRMIGRGGGIENLVETIQEKVLAELRAEWPDAIPAETSDLAEALEFAWSAKGGGFVFVIDEWDCPFREAAHNEPLQRRYLDFLRDLFKGAPYVDACYMTGILPIKKYGAHSALNIFTEYSMTDPKGLADLTGFNSGEVKALCGRFDMDFAEMRRWYDGYLVGPEREHVYNPRSVAGAIGNRTYSSFWTQTETFEALQVYIDMDFDGVSSDLVAMLDGQKVATNVGLFENDMRTFKSKDDVYTLLVHLGYLGYDQVERSVFIPNEEIRREFSNAIEAGARPQLAALIRDSRELFAQTLEGNAAYVARAIDRAHASAAAPLYYNNEQALRSAVKLAYIYVIDDYLRVDELPGGKGYADVAYIPKPGSPLPPMIVELKWNQPAESAIAQIKAQNYPAALCGLGGECVLVGITYDADTKEHECRIECVSLPGA